MSIIKNAIINSVSIRFDRDIFLCPWVTLSYGGGLCQGFGGYVCGRNDLPETNIKKRNYCGTFLSACMRAGGVDEWDKLQGKAIRVELDEEGLGATIIGIGHITDDDKWFRPKEVFKS